MSAVCLIPARGGSKRLRRKNVIPFLGQPIISYTIKAALESACFDRVVVSSDDPEILAVAAAHGASTVVRPPQLAGDEARLNDVFIDFLDAESAAGHAHEIFCCLFATAPLRTAADIRAVSALIEPGACDFAMAVTTFDLPPLQAMTETPNGYLQRLWPNPAALGLSKGAELLVDNGSTYFAVAEAFRRHRTFYAPTLRGYRMPRARSIDINDAADLEMAEWSGRALWPAHGTVNPA
jgi:pseudaminic acid cytidylyltransferase